MKESGTRSKSPLRDSFTKIPNLKLVLLALFGATAGQGVVWYTGQFYALFFLQNTLKIDFKNSYLMIAVSLIIATPFFIIFGKLSDKIGRKKVILTGCLIASVAYIPIFKGITHFGNPVLSNAMMNFPISIETNKCKENCYQLKEYLSKKGYSFNLNIVESPTDTLSIKIGSNELKSFDTKLLDDALNYAGYPASAKPENINYIGVIVLLSILVIFVAMVYGPIAAFLVELFPTRIRYTSMSFPYHIGNGWFGGFLPLIATSLVLYTGNIYAGLYYPIAIALMSLIIGGIYIKETKDNKLDN